MQFQKLAYKDSQGLGMTRYSLKQVGSLRESRHSFSYQVWRGCLLVIGGRNTQGKYLKTIEAFNCKGQRGTELKEFELKL